MERDGICMNEKDLQAFLFRNYGHENAACEWKEYKSLKHTLKGDAGRDLISYVSALSNMEGGSIVMGVKDKTLDIVGIQDFILIRSTICVLLCWITVLIYLQKGFA